MNLKPLFNSSSEGWVSQTIEEVSMRTDTHIQNYC